MDRGALLSKAHGNTGVGFFDSTSGGAHAKKIKMKGTMATGYLQDKIGNHLRLNHAEMMQDLYVFFKC